jgi:hypothetical protein
MSCAADRLDPLGHDGRRRHRNREAASIVLDAENQFVARRFERDDDVARAAVAPDVD